MSQPTLTPEQQNAKNVEMWKFKKLVKSLEAARGAGTSMISLIIPPKGRISRTSALLTQEHGTAANIKSHVNRLSVQSAITSTQARLKLYPRVPPNGLALFVGTALTPAGKEKKLSIALEPPAPLPASALYLCSNRFHTAPLTALIDDTDAARWGFIVIDGTSALFGVLAGRARTVLHKFAVDLPRKHARGGQSAARFGRIRDEKRGHYVRKVAERAGQLFISADADGTTKVNVKGLVLAGSAELKNELAGSELLDARLRNKVAKVVDVSYGGESGFNQAIDLAADALADVRFVQEKKIIQGYFTEISRDTGRYCYGVTDTLTALELGAVETLILWEDLDVMHGTSLHPLPFLPIILIVSASTEDPASPDAEPQSFLDHLVASYPTYGVSTLELVTARSQEGAQFVRGFGGVGALLRYRVDFEALKPGGGEDEEDEFYDSDTEAAEAEQRV
ncbi:peptide chain release factor eRF1/aRF1 [Mycena filopes]|nr:peptide chain release factor eRF1/aRF1 [Mycena filopes]